MKKQKNKSTKGKTRTNQPIEKYLEEISGFSPLPPEEEIVLARRIRAGDEEALGKLVNANLRFVVSVAKEYQGQGLPLQDLISEGNLGLIKAAQRFDETRGFKLISYAVWWIRQTILQALAEQSRVVRLPLNRVKAINKVGRALEALEKEYGREPSMDEIATRMDMSSFEVADVLKTSARHLSLDEPFGSRGDDMPFLSGLFDEIQGGSLIDLLVNESCEPPDIELIKLSLRIEVEEALWTLKPKHREVIELYFGLGGARPLNQQEIARELRRTPEAIRQRLDKALNLLRLPSRREPLRRYLG